MTSSHFQAPETIDPQLVTAYDYTLPEELIATHPSPTRDSSKLLVVSKQACTMTHHTFSEVHQFLKPNDLLVFNDTRVLPNRVRALKEKTHGRVELFMLAPLNTKGEHVSFLHNVTDGVLLFSCMTRSSKALKTGQRLILEYAPDTGVHGSDTPTFMDILNVEPGRATVRIKTDAATASDWLMKAGTPPIPPYILKRRQVLGEDLIDAEDVDRYQTVFARNPGAVAAPTAGLHLTHDLLERMRQKGVQCAAVTLHVGMGTFKPIDVDTLRDHHMHTEEYMVPAGFKNLIQNTKASKGRVVAVGTTSARVLESEARLTHPFEAGVRTTDIFLKPGNNFQCVDALITNFHLPKSTLLAMVATLMGYPLMRQVYDEAINQNYRFYSYGDSMLILP